MATLGHFNLRGQQGNFFYFTKFNCPNISIIQRTFTVRDRHGSPSNYGNAIDDKSIKEVEFGYGYLQKADEVEPMMNEINAYFTVTRKYGGNQRIDGAKYIEYVVSLKGNNLETFNDTNKCFMKLVPPKDGVVPTEPFGRLTMKKQGELLGIEISFGGKSSRKSYRRKHSRKRATRRRRHRH